MLLANIVPRDLRLVSEQMNVHYIEGGGGAPQSLWWGGSSNSSDSEGCGCLCRSVRQSRAAPLTVCGLFLVYETVKARTILCIKIYLVIA